jgi:hypothetical protein
MPQVLVGPPVCSDFLPQALELFGARAGTCTDGNQAGCWIANAVIGGVFPGIDDNQCLLIDNSFGVQVGLAPITIDELEACFDVLVASQMFALNNCPPPSADGPGGPGNFTPRP